MDENVSFNNFCTDRVYELATDIASEFEHVADRCGIDVLSPVVLKVIGVLEYLESTVLSLESSKKELTELKNQNLQLLSKNKISKTERLKLDQDLEELQESTDQEITNLKSIILKLRDDNKRLQEYAEQSLAQNNDNPSNSDECLIQNLQSAVSSLTIKLDDKNAELQEMAHNIIKLQSSVDDLKNANKALCNKICNAEKKMFNFYKDESDLKQQISEQKTALKIMEQNLYRATQQKMDLEESMCSSSGNLTNLFEEETEMPSSLEFINVTQVESEKELLLHKIHRLEEELLSARSETESFQHQYLQLKRIQTEQRSLARPYSIRQLFHFVLGVISPISGNFRCF